MGGPSNGASVILFTHGRASGAVHMVPPVLRVLSMFPFSLPRSDLG